MARKKDHSEVEYLRGLVREQKSTIRALKKQLGTRDKKIKSYEYNSELYEEETATQLEARYTSEEYACPECKKIGSARIIELGIMDLTVCDCGFRKKTKRKK
jgi:adenylyl- and sulfurtransferase ThiI